MTSETRLPYNVKPLRYEVTLSPDLGKARFSGSEKVLLSVLTPTDRIVLNAAELAIQHAALVSKTGSQIDCSTSIDEENERLTVRLPKAVPPGEWTLHLDFTGVLNDKLHGFYRSVFTDVDGRERVIATTQFEATDARRAFPCWDEPDRKAVFAIALHVDDDLNVYSNTSVVGEELTGPRRKLVRFADSVMMSTYLVAFVVGPLESTEPLDVDGVALSVVHPPGKEHLTDFALEIGSHALRFFTSWFGIDYPGDKLDLIAIPDFAVGAMENLGAVTFRETALLVDPATASRVELERVADVVAHEIAHMWFGDLVTMKWWNGIWLNEAFATFAEMSCVDAFRPNWQRWVTFGISRGGAMATDELSSTRPIEFPVERPEEAQGMFDVLTYEKGAGVLRMLEQYLGTPSFLDGLRMYLEGHLFSNAETTDLWDAIEEACGEPIRTVMDSWIFQGGHPMVTASISSSAEGTSLSLSAEPFRLDHRRPRGPGDAIGTDWTVPVLIRAVTGGTEESYRLLLGPDQAGVELSGEPDLVVVNAGGSGFYRTRYDAALGAKIAGNLGHLDPIELFNLVSDSWALALQGGATGDDTEPLAAFLRLAGEIETDDPNVWTIITGAMGLLDVVAGDDEELRDALRSSVRALLGRRLRSIGREPVAGEDEKTGTLRAVLVRGLGTTGADPEVRRWAEEMFEASREDPAALPPDLASAVAASLASAGSPSHYESFLALYRSPSTPQEEVRYLSVLPGFSDPKLFRATLEMTARDVRTQNAPQVFQLALANRERGADAWTFLTGHWGDISTKLPEQMLSRMLDSVSLLCEPVLAAEVHRWVEQHPLRTGQRSLDQAVERLDVNLALAERTRPVLAKLLTL